MAVLKVGERVRYHAEAVDKLTSWDEFHTVTASVRGNVVELGGDVNDPWVDVKWDDAAKPMRLRRLWVEPA